MQKVRASKLRCFDSFLTTLESWLDDLAYYFINRHTSGFVEGFNNKLKVIKRRCYGIVNVTHVFQRLQLDLYQGVQISFSSLTSFWTSRVHGHLVDVGWPRIFKDKGCIRARQLRPIEIFISC